MSVLDKYFKLEDHVKRDIKNQFIDKIVDKKSSIEKDLKHTRNISRAQSKLRLLRKRISKLENRGTRDSIKQKLDFDGRKIYEWNAEWKEQGYLKHMQFDDFEYILGLFKVSLNGRVVFVGKSKPFDEGALKEALTDFRCGVYSGKYKTFTKNEKMNLKVEVLDIGKNENSERLAERLQAAFVERYNPRWNLL